MSFQKSSNRVLDFLRNPLILTMLIIIILSAVILAIISVVGMNNGNNQYFSEVDPASGETIYFGPSTGGENDAFLMVGFEEGLISNGMTSDQFFVFKDAVVKYAEKSGIDLTRISYVKDSLNLPSSYVFEFSVALNIEEVILKVRVDSSGGWKNILGMSVTFWSEEGSEVYRTEVTNENLCSYLTWCEKIENDINIAD